MAYPTYYDVLERNGTNWFIQFQKASKTKKKNKVILVWPQLLVVACWTEVLEIRSHGLDHV
jgi:hypothetical protein